MVHRLVATLFVDNPHSKPEVNHIDSCKTNNDHSNLEWVTPQENTVHARNMGNTPDVTRKLNKETVREIKEQLSQGVAYSELTERYGVSYSTIKNIAMGRRWSSVQLKGEAL